MATSSAIIDKHALGIENPALNLDEDSDLDKTGSHLVENHVQPVERRETTQSPIDESEETFEDLMFEPNWVTRILDVVYGFLYRFSDILRDCFGPSAVRNLIYLVLLVLFNAFFFGAIYYHIKYNTEIEWCDGLGFLIILTVIFYVNVLYFKLIKPLANKFLNSQSGLALNKSVLQPIDKTIDSISSYRYATLISAIVLLVAAIIYLVVDTQGNRERLISGLGLLIFILFAFVVSKHPDRIVWRHVIWGLFLQFVFGLAILRWSVGKALFTCLGDKVSAFLEFTDSGSIFVYGSLVSQQPFFTGALNESSLAYDVASQINDAKAFKFVFMFKVLSVIYFFSFFVSMLFYLGWMQWLVVKMGWMLQVTVGTTACESLNAAANIFLGQSEAPLMIKPFLPKMTNSELHAVMTGGFATIAGSVLAAYISFGISASHLLSASVMSAPAALAMAKMMYPETKRTKTSSTNIEIPVSNEANLLDAASQGAVTAVFLVANIGATLIAVLATITFLNSILAWGGRLVGVENFSFELILQYIFIPVAWIMGVPWKDAEQVALLLGLKTFVNEFVAYERLASFSNLDPRSRLIATYALCGFSNPASIGVQIASLGTMAPSRRGDLSRIAFRSFVAGSLACFLTACIAGMLVDED